MPPTKKQGERIAELEEKLELVLKKLELEVPIRTTEENPDNKEENPENNDELPPPSSLKERHGRTRSRSGKKPSITDDEDEEYTPRNRRRDYDRARSYTPTRRPTTFSTKDVLGAQGAQGRAQQLLELLNPQLSQGKAFDLYSTKATRYAMPRMYVNMTAQKLVKQYRHQDDLTLPQYIEGFIRMIESEVLVREKTLMLAHLADVAVLLQDFLWEVVREWTNTVISSVGQGTYTWADSQSIEKDKIIKLMGASGSARASNISEKNACVAYNGAKCGETESHGIGNQHMCSFCYAIFGAEHDHPVIACHKRSNYKKKDRSEYSRSERYDRYDRGDAANQPRSYNENQFGQGRGRGTYGREPYYKQQYNRSDNKMWSQPPPPISSDPKNWQAYN